MRILMPLPEKVSLNVLYSGLHWSKRKKLADLYHGYMIQFRNHIKDFEYPVDVTYNFTFKGTVLDITNCFYMAKLLEDGLVHHKILRGDAPKDVTLVTATSKKGERDEVEIIIN